MLLVEVEGFCPEITKDLLGAAAFYAKILFHPNLARNLSFYIHCRPDLDIPGQCSPDDRKNRIFDIDIRAAEYDDEPCQTLAHEMTHCKQWAKGEFSSTETIVARRASNGLIELGTAFVELWNGKPWQPQHGEHPYLDSPWELEAFGREVGMTLRWRNYRQKEQEYNVIAFNAGSDNLSFVRSSYIPTAEFAGDNISDYRRRA